MSISANQSPDPEAVKAFIRKVCENGRLPYLTITPTFSICPYSTDIFAENNRSAQSAEARWKSIPAWSAICGPVDQWNDGKQAEFAKRATYKVKGGAE